MLTHGRLRAAVRAGRVLAARLSLADVEARAAAKGFNRALITPASSLNSA